MTGKTIGRIGPNIVVQLAAVVKDHLGNEAWARLLEGVGRLDWLLLPPEAMVPEADARALYTALYAHHPSVAPRLAAAAGVNTADYIMANRIPLIARVLLRLLPGRAAVPLLLRAIKRHAWTFAGSGECRIGSGGPLFLEIINNPVRMPDAVWHRTVIKHLMSQLACAGVQVQLIQSEGAEGPVDRFILHLPQRRGEVPAKGVTS